MGRRCRSPQAPHGQLPHSNCPCLKLPPWGQVGGLTLTKCHILPEWRSVVAAITENTASLRVGKLEWPASAIPHRQAQYALSFPQPIKWHNAHLIFCGPESHLSSVIIAGIYGTYPWCQGQFTCLNSSNPHDNHTGR